MAPNYAEPSAQSKQFLVRSLEAGQTGCIRSSVSESAVVSVYVMLGDVLAAHAEDDADMVLRRLYNARALTMSQVASARQRLGRGEGLSDVLSQYVADAALMEVFQHRFRENLFRFLHAWAPPEWEPLDAVMVDNIQVGHDSLTVIDELLQLGHRVYPLFAEPDALYAPGDVAPNGALEATLLAAVTPRKHFRDIIASSPFEASRTAALLADLVERGVVTAASVPLAAEPTNPGRRSAQTLAQRVAAATRSLRPQESPVLVPEDRAGPATPLRIPDFDPDNQDTADDVLPYTSTSQANLRRMVRQAFDKVVKAEPLAPTPSPPPQPAPAAHRSVTERLSAERSFPPTNDKPPPLVERYAPVAERLSPPVAERVVLTPPPEPVVEDDFVEVTEDVSLFEDYDRNRGGGDGTFTTSKELLDVVDLTEIIAPPPVPSTPKVEGPLEMEDAESAGGEVLAGAVMLNFAGPKLQEDEASRKVEVANEVLTTVARALDEVHGAGMGRARIQLLVEGTPGPFAPLFKHVEVDEHAQVPAAVLLKNLRKRPPSEHRRLLNRGLGDLIERALSLADESLDGDQLERMLEQIAGFQARFGV